MMRILYLLLTCLITITASAQIPKLNLVQVATGFAAPTDIKNCGDERIFVVERAGYIRIMSKQGNLNATPFLDIHTRVNSSGGEQGLLSVAFSPNYKQDGFFYVNYINGSSGGSTRISRFQVSPTDSNYADQATEKILLTFVQPYNNHNGGIMQFGNDGYLYDMQGDGGSGGDPGNNAQNINSYLGKILRLDVSNPDTTYTIPTTNPFYGQPGVKGEIWAYGLRNPWRASFDRITHDFWIADVGQGLYEEVDFQPVNDTGGQNYGWRCYEGNHPYTTCTPTLASPTYPIYEYTHAYGGCSITGGYVYRGAQYSKLWGLYLFTDYCSGKMWSIKQTSPGVFDPDTLQTFLTSQYSSFGEDNKGELYIAAVGQGRIYRITDTSSCKPVAFITMSDTITGCKSVTLQALKGDSLSYQWLNANGDINNATTPLYTVTQSGWYKVRVSKAQQGCEAISDSVYVVADTTAISVTNPLPGFCINSGTVILSNLTTPVGGIFSGTGVVGGIADPVAIGIGTDTISYTFVNSYGCISNRNFTIEINDTTVLTKLTTDTSFCINSNIVSLLSFVSPAGGAYTGTGILSAVFIPQQANTGTNVIGYTYINNEGCPSSTMFNISITDTTAVNVLISDTSICPHDIVNLNNFVSPDSGVFSIGGATISPLFYSNTAGIFTLLYRYNDGTCISNKNVTVNVSPVPVLMETIPIVTYCLDETPIPLEGLVTPIGGTYSGSGVANDTFLPAAAGPGNSIITYSYTNIQGCTVTDTFILKVDICTGLNELNANLSFSVYPNPNNGNFNIAANANSAQPATILIIDALGRVCFEKEIRLESSINTYAIKAPRLAKGIYSLQLKGVNDSAIQRMIIN